MQFTLWPSARANEGGHAEVSWGDFLAFVSNPVVAETKDKLEGWSPVRFAGNRRGLKHVEAVSCIVLDDDASGLPTEAVVSLWSPFAGVVHTSHSHMLEGATKHRVVLRCSRDLTAAEQSIVWQWCARRAGEGGQPLDESTKDPSRLWYCPAHRAGAPYAWAELTGAALDVDAILSAEGAASNNEKEDTMALTGPKTPSASQEVARDNTGSSVSVRRSVSARRIGMALAVGAAWPPKGGGRHEAQLALAGALRSEGFDEAEAVEFLCAVCRTAGDEDRPKREATVRHTWSRDEGSALTGWTRLKRFVDPVLVDAARAALGHDAGWTEQVNRRLAEASGRVAGPAPETTGLEGKPSVQCSTPDAHGTVSAGPVTFRTGGLDAEQPPLVFQVDKIFCVGEVVMLVAHGGSLKTWLALSLSIAISSGRPWLGQFMTIRGRAAILDFESGDFELVRRLKLLGAKDADAADRLLRASYSGAQLVDPETWIALAGLKLDLLVIDSFSAASPDTDENDARSAVMLQNAGKFANATSCTIIIIHHARKGAGGDQRELVRGSSALFAACDRIFRFDEPEEKDGGIVLSTMRPIKNGPGRRSPPVRVELSDAGLRWLEGEPVEEKKSSTDVNRALVLAVLRENTAGVPQEHLVHVMQGKREAKFELLSQMVLAGLLTEYAQGKPSKKYVMLRPGVPV